MNLHYDEYLQLDKILNAQSPESFKEGKEYAHDEMLFVVIHQTYELWFKQVQFEIDSISKIMGNETLNDNMDLSIIVHRLKRITVILKILVSQIDILETMTPMEFLSFRDEVRPASGFQSWQFKKIEASLGLKFDHRHGQQFYSSQLKKAEVDILKEAENAVSLLEKINGWLERMPFINDEKYWQNYQPVSGNTASPKFWNDCEYLFLKNLPEADTNNQTAFKKTFNNEPTIENRTLSAKACRSAFFICLFREYPLLEMPFQLLDTLLEIDNQLGSWRYRHVNMVKRMIGDRSGTGGSSGIDYLKAAMDKHYIFKEVALINSFLFNKKMLPALPVELVEKLCYRD